jgi:hypothetical protein
MTPQEAFLQALSRIQKAESNRLPSINQINLSNLPIDRLPQPLQRLSWLAALFIRHCANLSDICSVATLGSLHRLDLSDCTGIRDISPIARLHSLEELNLYGCAQVHDLLPLEGLASLRSLDLSCCPEIEDLSPLSALTSLEDLHLHQCTKVTDLSPLAKLTSLKYLDLSCCIGVRNISPLTTLATLKRLHIDRCKRITSLVPLRQLLFTLEELSVFGCDFDEAFAYGKRFKENVLDRVRLYYDKMEQTQTYLFTQLSKERTFIGNFEAGYKRHAGKILTALSLSLLTYFIWIAWPPRLAASKLAAAQLDWLFNGHQNTRKSYLDYFKIVVEVVLAVVVSGSVFATDFRNWLQNKLDSYTRQLNDKFERQIEMLNLDVLRPSEAAAKIFLWTLEKPRRRFLVAVFKVYYTLVFEAGSFISSMQNRIVSLILWTVLAKFPGGLFGLVALFLFLVLTWIKILRLYIDASPAT